VRCFIDLETYLPLCRARNELLAYSFFVGAQQAIWRGYSPIVSFLFEATRYFLLPSSWLGISDRRTLITRGNIAFPVSIQFMKVICANFQPIKMCFQLQEASYFASIDPPLSVQLLSTLLADSSLPPKLKAAAAATKKNIDSGFPRHSRPISLLCLADSVYVPGEARP